MLSNSSGFGKILIKLDADMRSSKHTDNNKKDILILGKVPTDGFDDITLTEKKEYFIIFTEQQKNFCYNKINSYIFVEGVEIPSKKFRNKCIFIIFQSEYGLNESVFQRKIGGHDKCWCEGKELDGWRSYNNEYI